MLVEEEQLSTHDRRGLEFSVSGKLLRFYMAIIVIQATLKKALLSLRKAVNQKGSRFLVHKGFRKVLRMVFFRDATPVLAEAILLEKTRVHTVLLPLN